MRSIDPAQVPVNEFIPDSQPLWGAISELDSEFFFLKKVSCLAKIYSSLAGPVCEMILQCLHVTHYQNATLRILRSMVRDEIGI